MSSILKALKKVEEEKSSPRGANTDIARAVLMGVQRREGKPVWVFAASLAGAALVAAALTYLITERATLPRDGRPPAEVVTKVQPESTRVVSPPPADLLRDPHKSAEGLTRPTNRRHDIASMNSAKSPRIVMPAKPSATIQRPKGSERQRSEEAALAIPAIPTAEALPVQRPAPMVTVSGIAWQKDGADRLAVVNGVAVSEGMTVSGVKVEKIFPDRVRFSFEKRTFEVGVGRDLP